MGAHDLSETFRRLEVGGSRRCPRGGTASFTQPVPVIHVTWFRGVT